MPIEMESPEQLGYANIRCNLAESSVTDLRLGDLQLDISNLVLAYGNHYGKPRLRELVAAKYPGITSEDVLITAGAANALFIVAQSLLHAHDRVIVEFPNYSTNIETPLAMGCEVVQAELQFEKGFQLDLEALNAQVNARTRMISVTTPHNPTGTMISEGDMRKLVQISERNNCLLLVDETYRDLSFNDPPPLAASISDNAVSISSLSKAYGLPGIRIGWIVTRNAAFMEKFLAAKEQIILTNSVLDEEVASRFLQQENMWRDRMKAAVREKFGIVKTWMEKSSYFEWAEPQGGVVCFPRFRKEVQPDIKQVYTSLFEKHATLVGRGHWFGMDDRYMRIGYGWPGTDELKEGLRNIDRAIEGSQMG